MPPTPLLMLYFWRIIALQCFAAESAVVMLIGEILRLDVVIPVDEGAVEAFNPTLFT